MGACFKSFKAHVQAFAGLRVSRREATEVSPEWRENKSSGGKVRARCRRGLETRSPQRLQRIRARDCVNHGDFGTSHSFCWHHVQDL